MDAAHVCVLGCILLKAQTAFQSLQNTTATVLTEANVNCKNIIVRRPSERGGCGEISPGPSLKPTNKGPKIPEFC